MIRGQQSIEQAERAIVRGTDLEVGGVLDRLGPDERERRHRILGGGHPTGQERRGQGDERHDDVSIHCVPRRPGLRGVIGAIAIHGRVMHPWRRRPSPW